MRKEYWIKKDPMKDSQDNWIKMNSFEFSRFRETEEGKLREKNVARVPGGEPDEFLYMEVDPETAKEWKSETNARYYQNQTKEELGISIISYHGITTEDDDLTGEDLLQDPDCNVEEEVIHNEYLGKLRTAYSLLDENERELVDAMFLSDNPMTDREYAKKLGIAHQTVCKKKNRILKKMKKMING